MPKMSEAEMRRTIHAFSEFVFKDNQELYLPVLEFLAGFADSICRDEPEITHRACAMIGFAVGRMWGINEVLEDQKQEDES